MARSTLRPMRPNPEIAILTAMAMFSGRALAVETFPGLANRPLVLLSRRRCQYGRTPPEILRHMGNAAGAPRVAGTLGVVDAQRAHTYRRRQLRGECR